MTTPRGIAFACSGARAAGSLVPTRPHEGAPVKRQFMTAMVAVVAIGSLIGLAPTAAQAQDPASVCFPPAANADYPPTGPSIETVAGSSASPTGSSCPVARTEGSPSTARRPASPTAAPCSRPPSRSTPTAAERERRDHFTGIHVPSDFQLNVTHHLDVFRQQHLVGAYDFCVTTSGSLAAPGSASCTAGTSPTAVAGTNGTGGTGAAAANGAGTKAAGVAAPHRMGPPHPGAQGRRPGPRPRSASSCTSGAAVRRRCCRADAPRADPPTDDRNAQGAPPLGRAPSALSGSGAAERFGQLLAFTWS